MAECRPCTVAPCLAPDDFFLPPPPVPPPVTYDQVPVCNQEQTATCPDGQTGDPVTIAAGVYCITLQFASTTPQSEREAPIAAAQAQMNAVALAQATAQLSCSGGGSGIYMIQGYTNSMFNNSSQPVSVQPAWDGVFGSYGDLDAPFPVGVLGWCGEQEGGTRSINGHRACNMFIRLIGSDWFMCGVTGYVPGDSSNIWSGMKAGGATPDGVYINDMTGLDPTPATVTVIPIAGAPMVPFNADCIL